MSDAWTNATPLRNEDFKALLATPRPASQQTPKQQHSKQRSSSGADGEKKFKKPAAKPRQVKAKAGEGDKEGDDGPQYRDRAKERREGVNVDFSGSEQELAARGVVPAAMQGLSIEQSKFLGGDIAHTHLVKGLDYALLHQERQKLEASKAKSSDPSAASAVAADSGSALPPPAAAGREALQFQSRAGRAVYDALFRPPPANRLLVREMFQPRRTAFVFEFGTGSGDVPTTLRRSKADCPAVQDVVSAADDGPVLARISQIVGYLTAHAAGKAGKKSARDSQYIRSILAGVNPAAPGDAQVHGQLVMKGQAAIAAGKAEALAADRETGVPAAAAAAAAATAAEDDDIFGDAGTDYVPELPKKQQTGDAAAAARGADGSLFDNTDHLADMRAPLPPPPAADDGDVDMDIEEGEVPGSKRAAAGSSGQGYGYPQQQQQGAPDFYGQQQQQQGYEQQQYGDYGQYGQAAAPATAAEVPKWRAAAKPGAAAALKGFSDEAYGELFPSMMEMVAADDEDDGAPDKGKPGAADAADGAAGAAGGRGGGRGGRGGRGGGGRGGGMDDMDRKLQGKLSREVQQMKGLFQEKGWGSEAAFKKEDKFDSVAATPSRKRIRL